MKERPILFSAPMVRAILDGSKTQTRRVVKLPPAPDHLGQWEATSVGGGGVYDQHGHKIPYQSAIWHTRTGKVICSPHGQPSNRLWVRETWAQPTTLDPGPTVYRAAYPACVPADYENIPPANQITWKPSIHMSRALSRILLEVTGVRVEPVQNITMMDAFLEGYPGALESRRTAQGWYRSVWEAINGKRSWVLNPWVWVIDFKIITDTRAIPDRLKAYRA